MKTLIVYTLLLSAPFSSAIAECKHDSIAFKEIPVAQWQSSLPQKFSVKIPGDKRGALYTIAKGQDTSPRIPGKGDNRCVVKSEQPAKLPVKLSGDYDLTLESVENMEHSTSYAFSPLYWNATWTMMSFKIAGSNPPLKLDCLVNSPSYGGSAGSSKKIMIKSVLDDMNKQFDMSFCPSYGDGRDSAKAPADAGQ